MHRTGGTVTVGPVSSTCPSCGAQVADGEPVCPTCSARLAASPRVELSRRGPQNGPTSGGDATGANAHVHLSPDTGIQTYTEPYPGLQRDASTRGPYIPGREIVYVSAAHGDWVQVTVDGAALGWVDGRQLVPPVFGSPARRYDAALPAPALRSTNATTVNIDALVGALAGVGVMIGALVDWTQGIAVNSFRIPLFVLFDPKTTSSQPRLGYVVVAIGLLGVIVSFLPPVRLLRVLFGLLALAAAALYCGQVASQLSDLGSRLSFTDVVGPGPWVTGIAGIVLGASPLLGSRF
jgi:hypothetical protein